MAGEQYEVKLVLKADDRTGQVFPQLNRQLNALETGGQRMDAVGGRLTSRFNSMRDAASGLYGIMAGSAAIGAVIQLNEIGEAANRADQIFTELQGSPEAAAEGMNVLREATLGVIDDMTLMQKTSQLMITGLAANSDEAARFLGLATRLGPAVGASVEEAVSSLNSALLNQSYDVLDSLGISAGAVRARANELKEAGKSFEEAFRIAVLEQGDEAIQRLGDSADVAAEGFSTARAQWNNWMQDIGRGINNTLNEAGNTVAMLGTIADAWIRQQQDLAAQAEELERLIFARSTIIGQQFSEGFETGLDPEVVTRFIEESVRRLNSGEDISSLMDTTQLFGMAGLPLMPGRDPNPETMQQLAALLSFTDQQNRMMDEAANLMTRQREEAEALTAAMDARTEMEIQTRRELEAQAEQLALMIDLEDGLFGTIQRMAAFMSGEDRGAVGGITLFTDEDVARANEFVSIYQSALAEAQEKLNLELITQEEFDRITQGADEVKRMADEIERGRDAFEDMTLQQGLLGGTEENELFGGLSDELLQALGDDNLTDEAQQEIRDALDRASGRATDVTFTLRDSVIPQLEELALGGDEDALVLALQGVETALREGRLLGLTDEQIAFWADTAADKGREVPYEMIARQLKDAGKGEDDFRSALVDPIEEAGEAIQQNIVTGMADANKEAEDFATALSEVTDAEHRVKITLDVSAPAWLQPLLGGAGLERVVRDSGGIVPGQDRRSGGRYQVAPT